MWELDYEEGWEPKNWCFWTVVLEKTLESPLTAGRSNQSILKETSPGISLEGMMLKLWTSRCSLHLEVFTPSGCVKLQYFATSCKELTHWKRLWCWEGLGAGGKGDDRRWDGWMASPTWWTWVWVNSGRWWWTGRPGMLRFMGSKRFGHDWVTELNWTELNACIHWEIPSGGKWITLWGGLELRLKYLNRERGGRDVELLEESK